MEDRTEGAEQRNPLNLTRRTVVKGAAWSVPIVAAAVAAPMAAASVVQTQCIDNSNIVLESTTTPVTPPYQTTTSALNPGYDVYRFQVGQAYEITTTTTITYGGTLPVSIADLTFSVIGTPWIDWTLTGTPTITSTRGNIALGSAVNAAPGEVSPQRSGRTTLIPTATDASDPYVHPGDTITITWNFIAHGPSQPIGGTGSGFAYTQSRVTCDGATTAAYPPQYTPGTTTHGGNIYQYVL